VLSELIRSEDVDMKNLSDLPLPTLKQICKKCGFTLSNKSAVSWDGHIYLFDMIV
jgi:hypothetical protein